jgi:D-arabinose 1-dehydrogenase-like Zn-dependent alcohol dehydrogenase
MIQGEAMRAITVRPGVPNSARLDDIPEPPLSDGLVLVRTIALGVCGTDREIISGSYGNAPSFTRRVPLDRWSEALEYSYSDIKVVIDFVQ